MYYRRWTRMHIMPALKYFSKLGVIDSAYQMYRPVFNNIQNPPYFQHKPTKKISSSKQQTLNTKLINKLFLKYPDLKYQSIGKSQYKGDTLTSFSYANAFLQQQKKLIKQGYTIDAAFQIVQKKFHQKIQRKMDQTLISRGLAIGNRARSFLTIYQQQIQYQAHLKTLRTKREVEKYQTKLAQIKQSLNKNEDLDKQQQYYTRLFMKVAKDPEQAKQKNLEELNKQQRNQKIITIEKQFKNMFQQFYERVAYKDRLQGLSDQQIKKQILASPSKIKNQTRQMVNYLRDKLGVYLNQHGDLVFSNPNIDPKLKKYLLSTPKIKIALLNEELGYQKPVYARQNKHYNNDKRKILKYDQSTRLSKEQFQLLKDKKAESFQKLLNQQIPVYRRSYRIFETQQQRLIRLELKYLNNLIQKNNQGGLNSVQDLTPNISNVLQKFRRLKYRVQKRYRKIAGEQLLFESHNQLQDLIDIQDEVQFESLIDYLRKKKSQRRLTSIDEAIDNSINEMINPKIIEEVPGSVNLTVFVMKQEKQTPKSNESQKKDNDIQQQKTDDNAYNFESLKDKYELK